MREQLTLPLRRTAAHPLQIHRRLRSDAPLGWFSPYAYLAFLLALIPLTFFLDVHTSSVGQQNVLGVGAWIILFLATRFSAPGERRQVWIMVGVATCIEVWSSIIWGIYRYRFGNLPLFVPPGHGMVYLFALRAARTPWVESHRTWVTRAALVVATSWALFGVTVEPLVFNRLDVLGLLWWPLFIWFMRKPSAVIYACAFFVTSFLELWGTNLGNWTWQVAAPISQIPTGNPPSVISAGYCLMDFTSIWIAASLPDPGFISRRLHLRRIIRRPAVIDGARMVGLESGCGGVGFDQKQG